VACRFGTEFGAVLEPMVEMTPGAVAAVLSDDQGDAIDFAHDPAEISEIDVQLLGAQIGQTVFAMEKIYRRHQLVEPSMLVESAQHGLLACSLREQYILALLLERQSNVGAAFAAFDHARRRLGEML
jgi:predicted regulator of Ras-like GTPase activity (Roadblock/LC7/MglB family)